MLQGTIDLFVTDTQFNLQAKNLHHFLKFELNSKPIECLVVSQHKADCSLPSEITPGSYNLTSPEADGLVTVNIKAH